jgi:uridine kinase
MNLIRPIIIGISGVSGAGKTTLARKLGESLHATTLFWDHYDAISKSPNDYVAWFHSAERNTNEWQYDALENVLGTLKSGKGLICPATDRQLSPTPYIIFDAPMGYRHQATGQYIDFLIFLDTPPDIALARRLLRDAEHQNIIKELQYYLSEARPLYIDSYKEREHCNLIIDGSLSTQEQATTVIGSLASISTHIKNEHCQPSLKKITRIGVYGILIKNEKMLLIKKRGGCYKGLLDLPGGGIEFGENPEEALRREFKEEVGMAFKQMIWMRNLSYCGDFVDDVKGPFTFHQLGQIYRITGEVELTEVEPEEQFDWYPLGHLDLMNLTPFAREAFLCASGS